jgi:hypothetical protein
MYKIQFDSIYGVRAVNEFDTEENIDIISQDDVFHYLRYSEDDKIYGCEVDMKRFVKIDEEYGVH